MSIKPDPPYRNLEERSSYVPYPSYSSNAQGRSAPNSGPSPDQSQDKLNKIKGQLAEAKGVMQKNVEIVIHRGEDIDRLSVKAEDLTHEADRFKDRGGALNRKMRCAYYRKVALIVLVLLLIAGFIAFIAWVASKH